MALSSPLVPRALGACCYLVVFLVVGGIFSGRVSADEYVFDVRMNASPQRAEDYRSTSVIYDQPDGYVRRVELLDVDPMKHHHMILTITPPGQSQRLLFVWSHNAPGYMFPPNSGFHVPRGSQLQLTTHYLARRHHDPNGFRLVMTTKKPKYVAKTDGIEAPPHLFNIPPRSTESKVQTACRVNGGPADIHAVMIHTHKHGTKVSVAKSGAGGGALMFAGDPRKPQRFNPIHPFRVDRGDVITLTCTYDTSNEQSYVKYGVGRDEMCGTYLIYTGKDINCRTVSAALGLENAAIMSRKGRKKGKSRSKKRRNRRKKRPLLFLDTRYSPLMPHLPTIQAVEPFNYLYRVPVMPIGPVQMKLGHGPGWPNGGYAAGFFER